MLNAAPDLYGFEISFYGPVYFYLQAWLEPLLGTGIWQFRLLNCLAGFGLVALLYRMARDLYVPQHWALGMVVAILLENVFGNLLHSGRMDFVAELLMLGGAYLANKALFRKWHQAWLYLGALLSGLALITTPRIVFLLPTILLPIIAVYLHGLKNKPSLINGVKLWSKQPFSPPSNWEHSSPRNHSRSLSGSLLTTHSSLFTTLLALILLFLPITYYIFISVGFDTYISRMQHPIVMDHLGAGLHYSSIFRQWYNIPLMLMFFYVLYKNCIGPIKSNFMRLRSHTRFLSGSTLSTFNPFIPSSFHPSNKQGNGRNYLLNALVVSSLIFLILIAERAPYSGMVYPLIIFIITHHFSLPKYQTQHTAQIPLVIGTPRTTHHARTTLLLTLHLSLFTTFLLKSLPILHTWKDRQPYQAIELLKKDEKQKVFSSSFFYYDVLRANKKFRFAEHSEGSGGGLQLYNETQEFKDWRGYVSAYQTTYRPRLYNHRGSNELNLSDKKGTTKYNPHSTTIVQKK